MLCSERPIVAERAPLKFQPCSHEHGNEHGNGNGKLVLLIRKLMAKASDWGLSNFAETSQVAQIGRCR